MNGTQLGIGVRDEHLILSNKSGAGRDGERCVLRDLPRAAIAGYEPMEGLPVAVGGATARDAMSSYNTLYMKKTHFITNDFSRKGNEIPVSTS